jgi:hypothetical protein
MATEMMIIFFMLKSSVFLFGRHKRRLCMDPTPQACHCEEHPLQNNPEYISLKQTIIAFPLDICA